MKIFGSFLLLFFGFASKGVAQENKMPDFKLDKPLVLPGFKFGLPENLQSFTPDSVGMDSSPFFNPGKFPIEREINFISPPRYQSRMPIQMLPDSDSRMPIKTFADSVNYTILKKEF